MHTAACKKSDTRAQGKDPGRECELWEEPMADSAVAVLKNQSDFDREREGLP